MFGWFRRDEGNSDEIREIKEIQLATARDLAQLTSSFAHLAEAHERTRQNLEHLAETVSIQANNIAGLVQVAQSHGEELAELRAGQAQQQAVLDYLLKKEQERQNGREG
jgi:chromosome segregation ATPase